MVRISNSGSNALRRRKPHKCTPTYIVAALFVAICVMMLVMYRTLSLQYLIVSNSSNSILQNVSGTDNKQITDTVVQQRSVQQQQQQQSSTTTPTIAYAVSVTGCGSDPITEGAAVLQHSIHMNSIHGQGRYDYKLFAIYHPDAAACATPLTELGYTLLERQVFVKVADIQGQYLREKIENNGCCGEKELIKLEAYTLTEYPLVVHLDLDVLILKPMDSLFDVMLSKDASTLDILTADMLAHPATDSIPAKGSDINAIFTLDYNMVRPKTPYKPVQGGFLLMRPNLQTYNEFKRIVLEGDFPDGKGWGGVVGPFHGAMTFQGLIPYYYNYLHPNQSVEVNRCIFNQMADNPRTGRTINNKVQGDCRDNTDNCVDCRERDINDIVSVHFTLCLKPWMCLTHSVDELPHRLCRELTHQWYRTRSLLEQSWGRPAYGPHSYDREHFYGFCKNAGKSGYMPIEKPYKKV